MGVFGFPYGKASLVTVDEGGSTNTSPSLVSAPPASRFNLRLVKFLRALAVILVVAGPLALAIGLLHQDDFAWDYYILNPSGRQFAYWVLVWLLTTWLCACFFYTIACWLPFLFRSVARYVNPAHQRYWRVLRPMRRPITFLGTVVGAWVGWCLLVSVDDDAAVNNGYYSSWDDNINLLMQILILWTGFYLVEKVFITYTCLHYHYRSDLARIERAKEMHSALIALYDASIHLYPVGHEAFTIEDGLIAHASGNDKGLHQHTGAFLRRIGFDTYKMMTTFGMVISGENEHGKKNHWFRPSQAYAAVERALGNEAAATAMATRIWRSFVLVDVTTLSQADVAEILGPYRKDDAEAFFKTLDSTNLGSLSLEDTVTAVTSMARTRHAIFSGIASFNHVINTLDWVLQLMLAVVMVAFILTTWVPIVQHIQQSISKVLIGMGFALGRAVNHLVTGAVFMLFDHPFDVGDKIELWNPAANASQSLTVTRLSLLYTVFKRGDTGVEMQVSNEVLATCRIENVSRSGVQKGAIKIAVDMSTSFQDLCALRVELETFIKANPRDYGEKLSLSIQGLNALDRMEIKCGYGHVGDLTDDKGSGQRNLRFMCAFISALRKVGIKRPLGNVGDQERPMHVMMDKDIKDDVNVQAPSDSSNDIAGERIKASDIGEAAAIDKLVKLPTTQIKKDDTSTASGAETHVLATGIRLKSNPGTESMFHQ